MMFLLRTDVECGEAIDNERERSILLKFPRRRTREKEKLIFPTLKINSLEFFLGSEVDHKLSNLSESRKDIFQRNSSTTERRALIGFITELLSTITGAVSVLTRIVQYTSMYRDCYKLYNIVMPLTPHAGPLNTMYCATSRSVPLARAVLITSFLSEFALVSEVVAPQHYRLLNIEATPAMSLIKPGKRPPRELQGLYTFRTHSSPFLPSPSRRNSQHDEVTFQPARTALAV
ncbi:hypothetical protein G5I_09785 [Acromyrmex echinatior]|uniref:Uncharacterized protein n=1 Tax=Acromyrmex echinatior TaxID=103372 RepID=F4WVB8_ACREC|nr:hypothetical protein G5I_09785 [Acromyrmex echinatior]